MEEVLVVTAVAFIAGLGGGEVATRLRQPAVVGEIIAGIIVGPAVLGWIPRSTEAPDATTVLAALAELGVIVLLFTVGLETDLTDLRRVGGIATAVAVAGVAVPFTLGWGFMTIIGRGSTTSLFVGTALVATSVGVTARVLRDMGKLQSREARVILGAAIVDDVLGLMLLSFMTVVGGERTSYWQAALVAALAAIFIGIFLTVGRSTIRRTFPFLVRLRAPDPVLGVAIALTLLLAASTQFLGLAPIIGAFVAGVLLAGLGSEDELEEKMHPIAVLLVPLFFVWVGTQLDLSALFTLEGLGLTLGITGLAIVGKFVACGWAASSLGRRSAIGIGVGMVPRGEVGIIVASLGLALGVIGQQVYGAVIIMSLVTTILAPPFLAMSLRGRDGVDTDSTEKAI